jgi:hypothetical protein
MAEHPRTTSARDHDDSDLIDDAVAAGGTGASASSSGGNLQTDIGSQDDLNHAIDDPGGTTRPQKSDDIANNQAYDSDRRGQS